MYWSVVGAFVAFDYLVGWLISWFPFYWELKTLFLLFLALPQTQGSTYIYQNYFRPFLAQHESALDEGIIAFNKNAFGFVQSKLTDLVNYVLKSASNQGGQVAAPGGAPNQSAQGRNPLSAVANLWNTYGGAVGAALQSRQQSSATATGALNAGGNTAANLAPRSSGASAYPTPAQEIKQPAFPIPQHQG